MNLAVQLLIGMIVLSAELVCFNSIEQDRVVNDASSSDFFIALTLMRPKMSIFIIFHESVTDGRTDRRTDGRTHPHIELLSRD